MEALQGSEKQQGYKPEDAHRFRFVQRQHFQTDKPFFILWLFKRGVDACASDGNFENAYV